MEDDNLQCVMSPHLAKILINKGFIVRDIKPNKNIQNSTVFLFDKSEELDKIMEEYKIERLRRKS
ncbi:MAG: DUF5659 domain-containing protein [Bacilli bacterium]|nr:DUF5659 domain-containing protein [Bacilli bacterium]